MQLSPEHIKYGKTSQIAKLLGKNIAAVSRWNKKDFLSSSLAPKYLCIDHQDLVLGLIARKERLSQVERYQQEFDEILQNSKKSE